MEPMRVRSQITKVRDRALLGPCRLAGLGTRQDGVDGAWDATQIVRDTHIDAAGGLEHRRDGRGLALADFKNQSTAIEEMVAEPYRNSTIEIEAVRTSIKRDARFEIANFGFETRHLRLANIWRIRYHDVEPAKRLAAVQCVPAISVDESCARPEPEP